MCSAKIIEDGPSTTSTTDVQQEPEEEPVEPSGQTNEVNDEVFNLLKNVKILSKILQFSRKMVKRIAYT